MGKLVIFIYPNGTFPDWLFRLLEFDQNLRLFFPHSARWYPVKVVTKRWRFIVIRTICFKLNVKVNVSLDYQFYSQTQIFIEDMNSWRWLGSAQIALFLLAWRVNIKLRYELWSKELIVVSNAIFLTPYHSKNLYLAVFI